MEEDTGGTALKKRGGGGGDQGASSQMGEQQSLVQQEGDKGHGGSHEHGEGHGHAHGPGQGKPKQSPQKMSEFCKNMVQSKMWKFFTFSIIGFTPVLGVAATLPVILEERGVTGVFKLGHWMLSLWLAVQFLFNFFMSQHTDAGGCARLQPTHGTTGQFEMVLEESSVEPGREEVVKALKYAPSFCEHCKHWKPPRAHHCSFSKRCVMRMDHFCPFTGNCIGFRNHGHFILMYFFAIIGLTYALLQVLYSFYLGWFNPRETMLTPYVMHRKFLTGPGGFILHAAAVLYSMTKPEIAAFATVGVLAFAAVLGFGGPALYLAFTNQTIIETHFPMKEYVEIQPQIYCPLGPGFYNRGWKQNIRDLLGPTWLMRLFLPVRGNLELYVAIAPRPSKVGAEALMARVVQVEQEGCQQEVQSVTQLGINPGPASQVAQNSV